MWTFEIFFSRGKFRSHRDQRIINTVEPPIIKFPTVLIIRMYHCILYLYLSNNEKICCPMQWLLLLFEGFTVLDNHDYYMTKSVVVEDMKNQVLKTIFA